MGKSERRFIIKVSFLYAFLIVVVFVLWAGVLFPSLPVPPAAYAILAGGLILILLPLNSVLLNLLLKAQVVKKKKAHEGITPHAIFTEIGQTAESLTKGKDIEVIADCHDLLMGMVLHADRTTLLRIVTGVLLNALRFTERGTLTILFSLVEEEEKQHLEIAVADSGRGTGQGVGEDLIGEFPFHASCPELSLSRALIDSLGGRMEIESAEGKGSVVVVTLPMGRLA
ncbi:MAG: hypothetical protein HGA78_07560 [Nitrospirales bacterium]|nr:hypothetical protein [Nitrospirales bacterium]